MNCAYHCPTSISFPPAACAVSLSVPQSTQPPTQWGARSVVRAAVLPEPKVPNASKGYSLSANDRLPSWMRTRRAESTSSALSARLASVIVRILFRWVVVSKRLTASLRTSSVCPGPVCSVPVRALPFSAWSRTSFSPRSHAPAWERGEKPLLLAED